MEAMFVVEPGELKQEVIAKLDELFAANDQPITVIFRQNDKPRYDPQVVLKQMAETRSIYPTKTIPEDIDINKLIDEMYGEGNH